MLQHKFNPLHSIPALYLVYMKTTNSPGDTGQRGRVTEAWSAAAWEDVTLGNGEQSVEIRRVGTGRNLWRESRAVTGRRVAGWRLAVVACRGGRRVVKESLPRYALSILPCSLVLPTLR